MRITTGLALIIGLALGVAGDGHLRQDVRDRKATAYQVQQCLKGDRAR